MRKDVFASLLLFLVGFGQAVQVKQAGSLLRSRSRILKTYGTEQVRDPESARLVVLLPAYKAAEEVESAFDWFSHEAIDDGLTHYVFITTARESDGSTARVSSSIASRHSRFHHLHSTTTPYCKASQLNDAVTWSLERWPDSDLRFAVYDIDGRPEVLPHIPLGGTFADIEQQVPLPARPELGSRSAIGRGHAAVQSVRALATEFWAWNKAQNCHGKRLLQQPLVSPAKYCWGNGLVIRARALEQIGGFPVPVDDLEVGYEAMVMGLTSAIRPEIVWHSAYVDPKQMTRSLGFILKGDNPFGHDRWQRSSPRQRLRLLMAHALKLLRLVEPAFWVAFVISSPPRARLVPLIVARYVVPSLFGARALSHLVEESSSPILLKAPTLFDTTVAAVATPGIRLVAWLKGHMDTWRNYAK